MFCFFVDGLDEYDGNHIEIIHVLKRLATSPSIKICVSSRPWNVFLSEFSDEDQRLLVEEHTRGDIQLFVDQTLGADERYLRLARQDPRCKDFTQQIVSKAQGVFLWVRLVVNEILRGMGNDDDITDLQRRLQYLPKIWKLTTSVCLTTLTISIGERPLKSSCYFKKQYHLYPYWQ